VHKLRTRLLRGYEPDPVPPPTVCAKAQRPPPAEGKAVTASPCDGRGTADEGPRGQQVRKRGPPQPAQLGYSTRTPSGMENRTGPCRAHPAPVYIPRGEPRGPPSCPRQCPLQHAGTRPPPHPCRGRSGSCAATAAPWVPRGCPFAPFCPPARISLFGPLATVRAAGSRTPPRARVSGVFSIPFAGSGHGATPTHPFARRYATP